MRLRHLLLPLLTLAACAQPDALPDLASGMPPVAAIPAPAAFPFDGIYSGPAVVTAGEDCKPLPDGYRMRVASHEAWLIYSAQPEVMLNGRVDQNGHATLTGVSGLFSIYLDGTIYAGRFIGHTDQRVGNDSCKLQLDLKLG